MKYIGIRGHRGAGKNTVAYLLANTLEYLRQGNDEDNLKSLFNKWYADFCTNENLIHDLNCEYVILEGFGDGPKILLSMLTGIAFDQMNNDVIKDTLLFNLRTFEKRSTLDYTPDHLWTAEEYFNYIKVSNTPSPIQEDVWMTLRELILYFGIYVMQNTFGLNVWVKSLMANQTYYNGLFTDDERNYKIFNDIKASTEITFIKDKKGVIIRVLRPGHEKNGGMNLLKGDNRFDYTITINDDINNLYEQILNIAEQII